MKLLCFFFFLPFLFRPNLCFAAFSNYNSILIGDRGAGMGGAFTSLTDDAGACSFYNPATLSLMQGKNLSAAINVYHKYDVDFDKDINFSSAPFRVNRGAFKSIPASSGAVSSFDTFAFGISIIVPDHDYFAGEIKTDGVNIDYLNITDESLWVGGTLALNLNPKESIGLTMYYTSRNLVRTLTDQHLTDSEATIYTEEKTFHNNSIIYILGYHYKLTERWALGLSYRFPSLEVSGNGSFFKSYVTTMPYTKEIYSKTGIASETKIPDKAALGVSYSVKGSYTLSFDLTYYGREFYKDFELDEAADIIKHKSIFNAAIGYEYYIKQWLRLRTGLYSNLSSHPIIDLNNQTRQGDHIDMWGWSANLAIYTSEAMNITLGGYYTGGRGDSTQRINQVITVLPKSFQIFSMLVGTAYHF